MKYTYAYKTSDGVRHEASMNAASRDDVFAELRKKGIKAIKVVSLSGSKANGEERIVVRKRIVLAALLLGLAAGAVFAVWLVRHDFRDPRLIALERQAEAIRHRHDELVATLHLEALRDYRQILTERRFDILNEKISVGFCDLRQTRIEIRELFQAHAGLEGAREVYRRTMDAIDLTEARLSNDEKAFRLLDANRGKWKIDKNRIVWEDARLEAEFLNHSRELNWTD